MSDTVKPFYQLNVLSQEQVKESLDLFKTFDFKRSAVYTNSKRHVSDDIRLSYDSELPPTHYICNVLNRATRQINERHYNLFVSGYALEKIIVRYDKDCHFNWHNDTLYKYREQIRKLTTILFLSEKDDFEGGDLLIKDLDSKIYTVDQKPGTLIVFPSVLNHVVKPITSGVRYTVVSWSFGGW